jgi:hypothetical protein
VTRVVVRSRFCGHGFGSFEIARFPHELFSQVILARHHSVDSGDSIPTFRFIPFSFTRIPALKALADDSPG